MARSSSSIVGIDPASDCGSESTSCVTYPDTPNRFAGGFEYEFACFEINDNEAAQFEVVEEQVELLVEMRVIFRELLCEVRLNHVALKFVIALS